MSRESISPHRTRARSRSPRRDVATPRAGASAYYRSVNSGASSSTRAAGYELRAQQTNEADDLSGAHSPSFSEALDGSPGCPARLDVGMNRSIALEYSGWRAPRLPAASNLSRRHMSPSASEFTDESLLFSSMQRPYHTANAPELTLMSLPQREQSQREQYQREADTFTDESLLLSAATRRYNSVGAPELSLPSLIPPSLREATSVETPSRALSHSVSRLSMYTPVRRSPLRAVPVFGPGPDLSSGPGSESAGPGSQAEPVTKEPQEAGSNEAEPSSQEAQPEAVAEALPEAEAEAGAEAGTQSETGSDAEVGTQSEEERGPSPEFGVDLSAPNPNPVSDPEPGAEAGPEPEPEPVADAEHEPGAGSEDEHEPGDVVAPEDEASQEPQVEAEYEAQAEPVSVPVPEDAPQAEPTPEPEVDPEVGAEAEPFADEVEAELGPEIAAEVEAEVEAEVDIQPEINEINEIGAAPEVAIDVESEEREVEDAETEVTAEPVAAEPEIEAEPEAEAEIEAEVEAEAEAEAEDEAEDEMEAEMDEDEPEVEAATEIEAEAAVEAQPAHSEPQENEGNKGKESPRPPKHNLDTDEPPAKRARPSYMSPTIASRRRSVFSPARGDSMSPSRSPSARRWVEHVERLTAFDLPGVEIPVEVPGRGAVTFQEDVSLLLDAPRLPPHSVSHVHPANHPVLATVPTLAAPNMSPPLPADVETTVASSPQAARLLSAKASTRESPRDSGRSGSPLRDGSPRAGEPARTEPARTEPAPTEPAPTEPASQVAEWKVLPQLSEPVPAEPSGPIDTVESQRLSPGPEAAAEEAPEVPLELKVGVAAEMPAGLTGFTPDDSVLAGEIQRLLESAQTLQMRISGARLGSVPYSNELERIIEQLQQGLASQAALAALERELAALQHAKREADAAAAEARDSQRESERELELLRLERDNFVASIASRKKALHQQPRLADRVAAATQTAVQKRAQLANAQAKVAARAAEYDSLAAENEKAQAQLQEKGEGDTTQTEAVQAQLDALMASGRLSDVQFVPRGYVFYAKMLTVYMNAHGHQTFQLLVFSPVLEYYKGLLEPKGGIKQNLEKWQRATRVFALLQRVRRLGFASFRRRGTGLLMKQRLDRGTVQGTLEVYLDGWGGEVKAKLTDAELQARVTGKLSGLRFLT